MSFFVYGIDSTTGARAARFFGDAATEAEARQLAEREGLYVNAVVPSHSTAAIVLPERPPPQPSPAESAEKMKAVVGEEFAAFNRTLDGITPRVVVTYGLIGANALVLILMALFGVNILAPSTGDLLRFGADYGPLTTDGQSWRLFSSLFVHIGLLHLAYNMIAFMYVAPTVERMLGNTGFLFTYITAGLAGGLWALFYSPMQIHAGASGSIFGIYGALLALLLRDRSAIPKHVLSRLRNFALIFVGYNLINSLRPEISLAAHVGGMAAGFLCGLLLAQRLSAPSRAGRVVRNISLGVCGIALFVGGVTMVEARYPRLDRIVELLDRSFVTMQKFKVAQKKMSDKQLSDAAFATLIEHELVPEWKSTRDALASLAPLSPSLAINVNAVVNYMDLRQQHWEALLSVEQHASGRDWLHSPHKPPENEELKRVALIESDYIDANVDLEFAKPEASARGDQLKRLQKLAAQVTSLSERERAQHVYLSFDDFAAFLERDQLPAWRNIQQDFADVSPLPPALAHDVTAILNHMRLEQDQWEPRVAYLHYEQYEKVAEQKRSRADAAAREIRNMSGAQLPVPY